MDYSTKLVFDFHKAFGIACADKPIKMQPDKVVRDWLNCYAEVLEDVAKSARKQAAATRDPLILRTQLMVEELGELVRAMADGDMVEALDALCDMRYVNDGTALTLGVAEVFPEAYEEVHSSNMSKLDDEGKPVKEASGRVVKSKNFRPPELKAILRKEKRDATR